MLVTKTILASAEKHQQEKLERIDKAVEDASVVEAEKICKTFKSRSSPSEILNAVDSLNFSEIMQKLKFQLNFTITKLMSSSIQQRIKEKCYWQLQPILNKSYENILHKEQGSILNHFVGLIKEFADNSAMYSAGEIVPQVINGKTSIKFQTGFPERSTKEFEDEFKDVFPYAPNYCFSSLLDSLENINTQSTTSMEYSTNNFLCAIRDSFINFDMKSSENFYDDEMNKRFRNFRDTNYLVFKNDIEEIHKSSLLACRNRFVDVNRFVLEICLEKFYLKKEQKLEKLTDSDNSILTMGINLESYSCCSAVFCNERVVYTENELLPGELIKSDYEPFNEADDFYENKAKIVKILQRMKILTEKKLRLSKPILYAALAIPLSLSSEARELILEASRSAGFLNVRVVSDIAAAALGFAITNFNSGTGKKKVLVYQLRHETFSVGLVEFNLVERSLSVLSESGRINFGGKLVNEELLNFLISEGISVTLNRKRKYKAIEQLKHELYTETDAIYDDGENFVTVTQEAFTKIVNNLFSQTLQVVDKVIKQAEADESTIEELLLIGGSAKIPAIQEMLRNHLPSVPCYTFGSQKTIAHGVSVIAQFLKHENMGGILKLDYAINQVKDKQCINEKCIGFKASN